MDSASKRKRDLDCPRITFLTSDRTFDRLFKEDSLEQLQGVVRKKLGLQPDAPIKLTRIRGNTDVDLDDEDDFDAFYSAVHSISSASIRITVLGNGTIKDTGKEKPVATPARKKRKLTASQTPASGSVGPTLATTAGSSSKRAASPVAESSEDVAEPPSKRVRVASPHPPARSLEKHPSQAHGSTSQDSAPTNAKSVSEAGTTANPGLTSPPAPNPSAPVEKPGTEKKKPAKARAKKSPEVISSSLGVKTRDEVLEEQAKAERELKKKEKPSKKERKKAGDDSTTVASTKGIDDPKDTSSKGKKAKASEAEKAATPAPGKQKKVAKSKAKVQEAVSDSDSETNDVLDVNAHTKGTLANISLSMIDKYLTPQVSAVEVGSKDSASVVRDKLKVPTCPYCGKSLTHDRSHCPLLRTKLVHTIEQRLEELKADDNEDMEVRSNAISALEAALQRRRPTTTNKEAVSVPSKSHSESAPPIAIATPMPVVKPTLRSRSSTSSESSSEEDSADEDAPPKNDKTSHVSVQPGGPSASTSRLLTSPSLDDDTSTGDSSENDMPHPGSGIKPKSIPFRPPRDDSDSSSSDSESEDVPASHGRGFPRLQPTQSPTLTPTNDGNGYNDEDLEALIRGPVPLKSADLPSSDSSEDEESESVRLDNESEQEPSRQSRKSAPSFAADSDSSGDDVEADDENEREPPRNVPVNLVPPVVATSNAASHNMDDPTTEALQETAPSQQVMERSGNDGLQDKSSDPPVALHIWSHDQLEEEERPAEESTLQTNGTIPDVMHQDPEREQPSVPPDLVTSTDASEVVPGAEPQSTAKVVNGDEGPSSPPPHTQGPREEPARASTPKPAMIQRMRGRTVKTPSTQKSATPLSLNQTAVAKPSTRKQPALRVQSKSTDKNETIELYQNEDDADAELVTNKVKAAPKKGAANTTKTPLTRAKVVVEKKSNGDEGDKEPDPPPRRSQRVSSKPPPVVPEVLHANLQPLTRKTRSTATVPTAKEIIESHPSKNPTKGAQKSKKVEVNVTVNPSLPSPESKDSDTVVSGSRTGKPKASCPPSPPVSFNAWETLVPETPVATTQSDTMIDELHSDMEPISLPLKPQHRRKASFARKETFPRLEQISQNAQERAEDGEKRNEKSLFMPSESQTVFPHSQFQSDSQEHEDGQSSDSEEEVLATVADKAPRSQSQPTRYRKLSDFTSQVAKMFTPTLLRQKPSVLQSSLKKSNTRKDRLDQLYGRMGKRNSDDIESDDESGHDSDSDASKKSHIPKSRKAGAPPKGRMSVA